MAIETFLSAVPKVELHLHLVGSASADTIRVLASRAPEPVVPTELDALRRFLEFRSFEHFIEVYATVNDLVQTAGDVALLVERAAADLAAARARYAEITVTPFMHTLRGMPYEDVVDGLAEGRRLAARQGVELAWIFDVPGEHGQQAAHETLDWALHRPPEGLVGFGLSGLEAGVVRRDYSWAFGRARAHGLHSVPHAGEGDGPLSVWSAVRDLHAERIGHGVRSAEDPDLVAHLAATGIPLEVCPSSNVCTRVYATLEDHPVADLMAAGVVVTINTDDPHMFGTDLNEEYRRLAATFGFGVDVLAGLVRAGIEASFMEDSRKRDLLHDVDAVLAEPDEAAP